MPNFDELTFTPGQYSVEDRDRFFNMVTAANAVANGNGLQGNMGFVEDTTYSGCFYRLLTENVIEWLNPPLIAGTEYRTTERFLGRPVYVRVVNAGAAPDTKSPNIDYYAKILPTPIANIGAVLRCDWVTNAVGPIAQCYDYGAYAGIFAYYNSPNITIYSKTDQSLRVTDSYVLLKYTKTSD